MARIIDILNSSKSPYTKFITLFYFAWLAFFTLARNRYIGENHIKLFLTATIFFIGPALLYIAWAPGVLHDLTGKKQVGGWRGFLTLAGLFLTIFTLANYGNLTYSPPTPASIRQS